MNAYLNWAVVSLRSKLETILDQFVLGIRSNCTHHALALSHPFLICCNPQTIADEGFQTPARAQAADFLKLGNTNVYRKYI
jgi:hypothetical protein